MVKVNLYFYLIINGFYFDNYQNSAMWNIFLFNILNVIMLYPEKFISKVVFRVIMDIILIVCYAILPIKI